MHNEYNCCEYWKKQRDWYNKFFARQDNNYSLAPFVKHMIMVKYCPECGTRLI